VALSEISLKRIAIEQRDIFAFMNYMKGFLGIFLTAFVLLACNNSGSEKSADQMRADSLDKEVDNLHGSAMGRVMQMKDAQKKVEAALDSISKLPANLQAAAALYKQQLDSLLNRMKYADFAMDKWMDEYKFDSVKDDVLKRIEYLESENLKIAKVKEAIVSSLQKADSLLHKK
jgi:hypothetical protein